MAPSGHSNLLSSTGRANSGGNPNGHGHQRVPRFKFRGAQTNICEAQTTLAKIRQHLRSSDTIPGQMELSLSYLETQTCRCVALEPSFAVVVAIATFLLQCYPQECNLLNVDNHASQNRRDSNQRSQPKENISPKGTVEKIRSNLVLKRKGRHQSMNKLQIMCNVGVWDISNLTEKHL